MDEDNMEEVDACLLRSRLHIRGGKKLLNHGRIVHAIGTLFDSVEYGMRWYYLCHEPNQDQDTLYDYSSLAVQLSGQGIFKSGFDPLAYRELMEGSLDDDFDPTSLDQTQFWNQTTAALTDLGVMPFDFDSLPQENEDTRKVLGLD